MRPEAGPPFGSQGDGLRVSSPVQVPAKLLSFKCSGWGLHMSMEVSSEEITVMNYFFLNKASKAARASAGAALPTRRPVASRTACGLKRAHSFRAVLDRIGAGISVRHSHRADGSKWEQLRQMWRSSPHFSHTESTAISSRGEV